MRGVSVSTRRDALFDLFDGGRVSGEELVGCRLAKHVGQVLADAVRGDEDVAVGGFQGRVAASRERERRESGKGSKAGEHGGLR